MLVDSLMKQFNSTALARNVYLKEAASHLATIGNQVVEAGNNLMRIQKVSKLETVKNNLCWCDKENESQTKTNRA